MNKYQYYGFKDRQDYLDHLSDLYHVPEGTIEYLSDLYGPDADFDRLVVALEEYDEVLGRL
jgi:hypothetical protein